MTAALEDARSILSLLQTAVDSRDLETLTGLFDDGAVLIGAAGDGRDRDRLRAYLEVIATQPASLHWEWQEIVPFHQSEAALGFAAFGEVVQAEGEQEQRAPIRVSILAVRTPEGWKLRHFHGSIPAVG